MANTILVFSKEFIWITVMLYKWNLLKLISSQSEIIKKQKLNAKTLTDLLLGTHYVPGIQKWVKHNTAPQEFTDKQGKLRYTHGCLGTRLSGLRFQGKSLPSHPRTKASKQTNKQKNTWKSISQFKKKFSIILSWITELSNLFNK